MTCSSGSTWRAISRLCSLKASMVSSRISVSAFVRFCSSAAASSEKTMCLSWISSAVLRRLTAWSPRRSKSPMVCSMFETFRESAMDSERLESLTRKVPSLSS